MRFSGLGRESLPSIACYGRKVVVSSAEAA
jgi:hypothetical protein